VFIICAAGILFLTFATKNSFLMGARVAMSFIFGAFLSAAAGWAGMAVATEGNVRTTVACTQGSLNDGLVV